MFRRARSDERDLLDEMTLAGLRHWGHDEHHPGVYAGFADQLRAGDGPEKHPVFVLEEEGNVVAFYELRDRGDHVELLRMFIRTDLSGHGYGRVLWNHAIDQASQMHERMLIVSDPGAVGFYEAMGAIYEKSQEVATNFVLGVYWFDLGGS